MDGCETMWVLGTGAGTSARTRAFNCYLSSPLRHMLLPVYMYSLFEYILVVEDLEHMATYFCHLDELTIYFQSLNYFAIIPTKYDVFHSYIFSFMHVAVYILRLDHYLLYSILSIILASYHASLSFWVSFSPRLVLLCVWTMYFCMSTHMPQRACGSQRKPFWSWFQPSTFTWVFFLSIQLW